VSENAPQATPEAPRIEQGAYEVLRARLVEQARALRSQVDSLNARRLQLFGGQDLEVIGNERIRTKNACIPRDIVTLAGNLLFGYEVKLGLKSEVEVDHVLSLYSFTKNESSYEFRALSSAVEEGDATHPSFLDADAFKRDFRELFKYYKNVQLQNLRLVENGNKLLAIFLTGANATDLKVLRWAVDPAGNATYIDNRGERDNSYPPAQDFSWEATTRENYVMGRHPHVSVLNEVFVETVGGDLTVKVENNTEDGLGIYSEKVDDPRQTLQDAQIHYCKLAHVILLKVLPYRETGWRHLIFNVRTQTVHNVRNIGWACRQLPEDHGLIFPGGYYLQEGTLKTFDGDYEGMIYETSVFSPNGEDVLFVFRQREQGRLALQAYNLIRKEVRPPIHCNGYSLFEDGTLVLFRTPPDGEPSRVHAMQIWRTPFATAEHHERSQGKSGSYLENIGNAELVRGVSDCLSIARRIEEQQPSLAIYEDLLSQLNRATDVYVWLGHAEVGDIASRLQEIKKTSALVLEEFDKVTTLQKQARKASEEASNNVKTLARKLNPDDWHTIDNYVEGLAALRNLRGHLITLKDMRYAALDELNALEQKVVENFDRISLRAVEFLLGEQAFVPYLERIDAQVAQVDGLKKATEAQPLAEELAGVGSGLELLTDIIGTLKIDDATVRTAVLERIAELMGQLNRARALVQSRRKELGAAESSAEFGVQFQLLSQSVTSAINLADSPEKCDTALSRLMLQLEDMESRFGEYEDYLEQLTAKREDVYKSISSKKQTLVEARQRRVQQLVGSAERILEGIVRRAGQLKDADELNAYFAADAMVMKIREICERLRELADPVKADELESKLKSARQESGRSLRDRQEIFEEGAAVVKLGQHRFSVNTEPLELTMLPRHEKMCLHVTGTDFFEPLDEPALEAMKELWDQNLASETEDVYRAEYLASCILVDAEIGEKDLSLRKLQDIILSGGARESESAVHPGLVELVRHYATERYDEGYERGIHDVDTALILEALLGVYESSGHMRFPPRSRGAAALFWAFGTDEASRKNWTSRSMSLKMLTQVFGPSAVGERLAKEFSDAIASFAKRFGLKLARQEVSLAGTYLLEEMGDGDARFVVGGQAVLLRDTFLRHVQESGVFPRLQQQMAALSGDLAPRFELALAWLTAYVTGALKQTETADVLARHRLVLEEAAVLMMTEGRIEREVSSANTVVTVRGLLGQHARINNRVMEIRLEEFLARLEAFRTQRVPLFREYQALRMRLLARERSRLRLDELHPKVMSAFVRNKLINEVYLPLIGNNLAKQMGAVGANKRTDLMGMLLLISPPGYGKTTLMEYIASRLGLIFVKVNGPALGHAVTSLDPAEAPNATARQEVDKINFALEMGNNVMLYLDDIQHTNPELLQKFISLCDAQRRIEGVWKGRTRTYDLKGKRFCICMAGNPYTESGARFQIPDMLANRADTYNLGDVLAGQDHLFELSYLENSLTSNPVLAPLASREPEDIYKLIRMAEGVPIPANELSYNYSAVEMDEIMKVLQKLLKVQKILLKVNKQYIASASMDDAYRNEPAFKLQGSYRNMTKLTEKIVPVMNDQELEQLIDDHYISEGQTLTTGAEQNLLKLAEIRDRMSDEQRERWTEIKRGFSRRQVMGDHEEDPAVRITSVLGKLSEQLEEIADNIQAAGARNGTQQLELGPMLEKLQPAPAPDLTPYLKQLNDAVVGLAHRAPVAAPPPQVDLAPLLGGLNQALTALAESRPAPAPAPAAASAPAAAPPQRIEIASAPPETAAAFMGSMDTVLQIVPRLRQVAARVRGPKAKTILMDARLVAIFDGLKEADSLAEVLEALNRLDG